MVLTNLQGTAYTPAADLPNGPIRWSIRWLDAISNSCHSAAAEFIFETTVLSPVRTTSDIAPTIVRRQVDNAVRYVVYLLNQDAPAVKMMILKTSGPCQRDLKRRIWEPRRRRCPQHLAHRTITAAPPRNCRWNRQRKRRHLDGDSIPSLKPMKLSDHPANDDEFDDLPLAPHLSTKAADSSAGVARLQQYLNRSRKWQTGDTLQGFSNSGITPQRRHGHCVRRHTQANGKSSCDSAFRFLLSCGNKAHCGVFRKKAYCLLRQTAHISLVCCKFVKTRNIRLSLRNLLKARRWGPCLAEDVFDTMAS